MFLLLTQFLLVVAVKAQTDMPQRPTCEPARAQAESSFRQRNNLKTRQQAEIDLKHALDSCALSSAHLQLQRRLRTVQEEIAMTDLQIAIFYLNPYADGIHLRQGATSRLRTIDENYPRFTQMDRVLFVLGDLSYQDGDKQGAANYFRRVVKNYPRSRYARKARKRLSELAANGET